MFLFLLLDEQKEMEGEHIIMNGQVEAEKASKTFLW